MCLGDNGAAKRAAQDKKETEAREAKRQADITQGKTNIDDNFAQFDDNYYGNYRTAYDDYYIPQIDDQYSSARAKLIAALTDRGTLESTAGISTLANLQKERDKVATDSANKGQDAANQLRSNVEKTKTDLYSLNEASADPQGMNARAKGEATALVAQPAYDPLGQVFASFLSPIIGSFNSTSGQAYSPYTNPVYGSSSSKGSGKVIG